MKRILLGILLVCISTRSEIGWNAETEMYCSTYPMDSIERAEYNYLATVVNEIIWLSVKANTSLQFTFDEIIKALSVNNTYVAEILLKDLAIIWGL